MWQAALLTMLVVGVSCAYFHYFPDHCFRGYSLIPLFFFAFGMFATSMVEMYRRKVPRRLPQVYLLMRVMHLVFSLIIMVVYCMVADKGIKAFLLMFVVNYLLYLIFDSWFFFRYERKAGDAKNKKCNETNA